MTTGGAPNASLIEKIRRLRALAQSSNVNEAAAAAAAAETLIQKHNLAEAVLESESVEEEVTSEETAELGTTMPLWKSMLCSALARAYQCAGKFATQRVWNADSQRFQPTANTYVAYGRASDLATLKYQYAFFSVEIERLCSIHAKGRGRTYANSFRLGAMVAIVDAIGKATGQAREGADARALVIVDQRLEAAKAARAEASPNAVKDKRSARYDLDRAGYEAGQRAGSGVSQRSQLAADGTRLLAAGATNDSHTHPERKKATT